MGFLNNLFGKHSLDNELLNAISQSPEKVRVLLEKGANANAITNEGISALMLACQYDNNNMIRSLLQHGADPNTRDTHNTDFWGGCSALIVASEKGHVKVAEALLEHGADPDIRNMYGETALIATIKSFSSNKLEIVKLLLAHKADVNACPDTGETALTLAVRHADSESLEKDASASIIRILLDHIADVNASDKNGYTALMVAAECGNAALVKMLLNNGADPGHTSNNGDTALSVTDQKEVEVLINNTLGNVKEEIRKITPADEPNYICKLERSSRGGHHRDIFYRMLLAEKESSLASAIINNIQKMQHDSNLIVISWAGLPALAAAAKSKNALPGFKTYTLEGVLGREALNKKQSIIADEINQDHTGQYVIWGVYEDDHLLCNLNHRLKIALYAVELRPGILDYLTWINNLIDDVCLPGGGDLLSAISVDDPMLNKEHGQILKQILERSKRTEEDEKSAMYLLQQLYKYI